MNEILKTQQTYLKREIEATLEGLSQLNRELETARFNACYWDEYHLQCVRQKKRLEENLGVLTNQFGRLKS